MPYICIDKIISYLKLVMKVLIILLLIMHLMLIKINLNNFVYILSV